MIFYGRIISVQNNNSSTKLSRRQFLRIAGLSAAGMTFAGLATNRIAGGAALAAARRQESVVLRSAGWPFAEEMPAAELIANDPSKAVYAQLLQAWLDQNPGVSIERVEFNIWDQQTLITGLAGGAAPTAYHTTVLGNYNIANTRAAFAQGLAADVTEYYNALGIDAKLPDYVKAQMGKWILDGKYYGLPTVFNPGVGFIYRKDFFVAAGIPEPTPDWTWADLKAAAKALTTADRFGVAFQRWALSWWLEAEGIDPIRPIGGLRRVTCESHPVQIPPQHQRSHRRNE
jgi:ABC-type glycerol-3-phosphate transport system substrate-binding protein